MRLPLREFQEQAVTRLLRYVRGAAKDARAGDLQSVCLSSPTGSGKTVMVTTALEVLIEGDDEVAPMDDATFLWITDQPELNVQTRKKMLATSSVFTSETLIILDAGFDQEMLTAGAVHFLNIQKLGKGAGLVSRGDHRTYTIWETIRNTIEAKPGRFFVIIDEAHRGMIEDNEQIEASTIIQKFIKGSPGELPPVPVILGISATPERFNRLIVGTGRMSRPVDVDPADVRESGLIKETIILHHPKREQPTDMTLLREAAQSLKGFTSQWATYCDSQDEFEVLPLLVVQVDDASNGSPLSETDIALAMRMIRDTLGNLPNDAFAHSFQQQAGIRIGGEDVRYIAPSDIQEDPSVRVVFFKSSLNTGWDCPRAEVMMSFRSAGDSTHIAQLVGRMVRTPLARRIIDNETLNTVALYLPHYNSKELKKVIEKLSKPDGESRSPVEVKEAESVVELHKAAGSEKMFSALAAIPSYIVPRKRKSSQVKRLMKLARLLTNDELDDNALTKARAALLKVLNAEYKAAKTSTRFKQIVDDRAQIEIAAVNWDVGSDSTREGEILKIDIASENVEDLFEATGRKLTEGLHKAWWRERVANDPSAVDLAKLELFALCIDPDVLKKVEKVAQEKVQEWLRIHASGIQDRDEASRAAYSEVRNLAANPELVPLIYPGTIQSRQSESTWTKHLYVDANGLFPETMNSDAEVSVLNEELARREVIGWLRNAPRKPWALCVPYEVDGESRPMYPDFIFVRNQHKQQVVDIVEPHTISLADAPAKAAGLAKFAALHADKFGRIDLILIDGNASKRFDLTDETVRNKLKGVKILEQLKALF